MSTDKTFLEAPPGLGNRVSAPVFVPSSSSSNLLAQPFVPGLRGTDAQQDTTDRDIAVNAMNYSARNISARPFVPNAARTATVDTTSNPALSLPEDDDVLGMSSSASAHSSEPNSRDLATQAAQMFRAIRPFEPVPSADSAPPRGPPGGGFPSISGPRPPHSINQGRGRSMAPSFVPGGHMRGPPASGGRGFSPVPPNLVPHPPVSMHPHQGPPPQFYPGGGRGSSQAPAGGRGRGRGGRGRGGGGGGGGGHFGPGASRPFIAAYALTPGRRLLAGQFMSETLRQDMQQRSYLESMRLDTESLAASGLPQGIGQYLSLYPLEDRAMSSEIPSSVFGVCTFVCKGVHSGDGAAYALRRLDGRHAVPTADLIASAEAVVERWSPLRNHPNIVGLREVFVSDDVDATPSLVFSYDYHPGAYSLEQAHVMPTHQQGHQGLARVAASEEQLWSYLVQLTAGLRSIHSAGLVAGPAALSPSKILFVAPKRVRLGAVGIAEALAEASPPLDIAGQHREDLAALGSLVLVLACAARNAPPALDVLAANYSRELCHVVAGLLASPDGAGFASWRSLFAALGDRVFAELESSHIATDTLAGELQKECENGRLVRLLIKLCMVNGRPDLLGDSRWGETGDRYLLKLFMDFVFHQVSESGAPRVEWGSIIEALNKADAGVDEKILLLSRDETAMLVVSYADVRRCLHSAYEEIKKAAEHEHSVHVQAKPKGVSRLSSLEF